MFDFDNKDDFFLLCNKNQSGSTSLAQRLDTGSTSKIKSPNKPKQ